MAPKRRYQGDWDDPWFPKSGPPLPVKNGIKARSKRGQIGETWWSERWVEVLENLDMGARLSRGRSYARRGQVMNLEIEPGKVTAKVQGSRPTPYDVVIALAPLAAAQWEKVVDVMASQAIFAAKLLASEMPRDIEEAFVGADVPLFPAVNKDLKTDCSCPDWSNPCKHIAAVYLLLAEEFDRDPFMLFHMRGMGKDRLIATLRDRRTLYSDDDAPDERTVLTKHALSIDVPPLESLLDRFWSAGEGLETLDVSIAPPSVPHSTLKRLGQPSFWRGHTDPLKSFTAMYDETTATAMRLAYGEEENPD